MLNFSLKSLLSTNKSLLLPVAHDALTAKLIEMAGFKAFSIGGFGVAASAFGLPDNGSVGFAQFLPIFKNILNASSLPVLVDADTGYGGPEMAAKVISTYETAGASAIFIEDQVWPKRCGQTSGHKLISPNKMADKINSAKKALRDPDTILMARTDAISAEGSLDAAVKRAKIYIKAGADAIFIEAPRTINELNQIPQELPGTILLANMIEGGKTPIIRRDVLEKWGFKLIAHPLAGILAQTKVIRDTLSFLKENGTTEGWGQDNLYDFTEFRQLIGL
ncbi:oxaloacetate decarboxylase [Candidatus Collierbacteria bacterium]|nr:oxaloacetate decarboxylase [Candidatus Collierbacteria bacterium]